MDISYDTISLSMKTLNYKLYLFFHYPSRDGKNDKAQDPIIWYSYNELVCRGSASVTNKEKEIK